ncbi:MAG: WXG100 family type VII secretion target [Ruminococcus sp.]|jgi:WXG100 family type VII secretion target|nr:WXG100 family type VII secretion target [Ruminococcus sp.]
MASNFKVTASNLKSTADQLEEMNAQFKTTVSELESTEASLSSMWEGEARDAFHKVFAEDKGQMDEFTALISKYAASLNTIAANYATAEQTNTQTAATRNS